MPQDNNIQQKLQQLENQQLPDLSQMDKHWEEMQEMLLPANPVVKPATIFTKVLNIIAGIAVVVTGVFIVFKVNSSNQKDISDAQENITAKKDLPTEKRIVDSSAGFLLNTSSNNGLPPKPIFYNEPIYADVSIAALGEGDSLLQMDDVFFNENNIDQQALTNELFKQLSKPAQHFSIDNRKDTILVCKGGTVVMVQANSFMGEDSIDFEITEVYDYSDMVLNRLTTKSDSRQLISGGMLQINAYQNEKPIDSKMNKTLKVYVPGLTERDSMQLFKGNKNVGDTMVPPAINWALTNTNINAPIVKRYIRALDFCDWTNIIGPIHKKDKVIYTGYKTVFAIARETDISVEEIKKTMREKYPDYKKMRFRKNKKRDWLRSRWGGRGLGDTAVIEFNGYDSSKDLCKYTPIDTVYSRGFWKSDSRRKWVLEIETDTATIKLAEKYNFLLDHLGWINCDRFYNYPGKKTDFFVNVEEGAANYFTVIVFEKFKSIMNGNITGSNKRVFQNLPVGEAVKIISIGINREGKSVMAIRDAIIGKESESLVYEEMNADTIKNSLSILNK